MSNRPPALVLANALSLAERAHAGQLRKGTQVPYIAHPLAVASLVLEYGGSADQAIAALLHDAIEDGGMEFAGEIQAQFGTRVRELVEACTDGTAEGKAKAKSPEAKLAHWRERKLRYLARLKTESEEALLVTACDKLHNARAIVADLERIGPAVFERFTPKREGTLWYYGSVLDVLRERGSPVADALGVEVSRIWQLSRTYEGLDKGDTLHLLLQRMDPVACELLKVLLVSLEHGAQEALKRFARAMSDAEAQLQRLAAMKRSIET